MNSSLYLLASGSNACGQLATGSLQDSHRFNPCLFSGCPLGALPPNANAILKIACGSNHTLILIETVEPMSGYTKNELWGCGDGRKGQLGSSLTQQSGISSSVFRPIDLHLDKYGLGDFDIRLIAAGWETSFIVLSQTGSSDVLISMGANDFGDLGVGHLKGKNGRTKRKPLNIVDLHSIYNYQFREEQLEITSLIAGPHHIVLQLQLKAKNASLKQSLVGWGTSRHGQLGEEFRTAPFISSPQVLSVQTNLDPISSIALGNQHTVFLHHSGQVSGMGTDKKHQISGISALKNATAIGCTWNGTYVMVETDESVRLLSNGSNSKGQLGRASDEHGVSAFSEIQVSIDNRQLQGIACGSEHVLALFTQCGTEGGEVWGWGWNEHGNLGVGNTEDCHEPRIIWPPELQVDNNLNVTSYGTPISICAGCGSSWIVVTRDKTDTI